MRGLIAYLAISVLAVLYLIHRAQVKVPLLPPFWDFEVYRRALADWKNGADPWIVDGPMHPGTVLPFVSPPLFLYLMDGLSRIFPGIFGCICYGLLVSASVLGVPAVLARWFLPRQWMSGALCLVLFLYSPGKSGSQAWLSGNFSNVLYALVLMASVPGLRRRRWSWFYAAVVFAAWMKPTFLAFLVLPLLADEAPWWQSLATAAAVLAGDAAQWALVPRYWREFENNVVTRLYVQGDTGFGLGSQMGALGNRYPVLRHGRASLVYAALVGLTFLLLVALRSRRQRVQDLWVPALLIFAVLCNPRILAYDIGVAVVAAVYILVETGIRMPDTRWRGALLGVPAVLYAGVLASAPETALSVLCFAALLVVIAVLAWPVNLLRA